METIIVILFFGGIGFIAFGGMVWAVSEPWDNATEMVGMTVMILGIMSFLISIVCIVCLPTPPTTSVSGVVTGKNEYRSGKIIEHAIYIGRSEYDLSQDQYNIIKIGDNVTITLSSNSVDSIVRN